MEEAASLIGGEKQEVLQLIISGHIRLYAQRGKSFALSRADVEQFSMRD